MNSTGLKELLEAFVAKDCKESEYPSELDALLSDTAKTGAVKYSWQLLKPLLKFRLESVLKSDSLTRNPGDDRELPKQLSHRLDTFNNPPFTIQRLCELVMYPKQHYKSRAKYMRAMEKNLMVVSTHEPDCAWMKTPRLSAQEPAAVLPGRPNHNHTPNHYTAGVSDTPDHTPSSDHTSSAMPVSPAEETATTHSLQDHKATPTLLDQTNAREVTHPSQERGAHNQKDLEVTHPQEAIHPSADLEMTHPLVDREVTRPSPNQKVACPSADQEMTHPSADKEMAQQMTGPSADQEMTRTQLSQKVACPSAEVTRPSQKETVLPSDHELTPPSQEVTCPSADIHEVTRPSQEETVLLSENELTHPSQEVTHPSPEVTHPSPEVTHPSPELPHPSQDYHSSLGLPRKRSSSLRDSLDGGVGHGMDHEVMGLVLQEADSTTIEHTHIPSEGNQEVGVSTGNLEQESNGIKLVGGANTWGQREEAVHMEKESEKTLDMENFGSMKKVRYLDAVEMRMDKESDEGSVADVSSVSKDEHRDDVVLGSRDEGGIEEVGVAEMRRKELYKEAATGQVEPETQTNHQLPEGMEKNS